MATKKRTTKKTAKRTKATKKTGEALRQEALKEAEANVAKLEAAERAPAPAPGAMTPTTAAPAAMAAKTKPTKPRAAKIAPKANTGCDGAKRPGDKAKKLSGLDAAANVLTAFKEPMKCADIAARAIEAGWKTNGATPAATLHAAISREIAQKGRQARFKKAGRGLFAANK